jgi:hypothetical protein
VQPTKRPTDDWELRFFPETGVASGRGTNNLFRADWFPNDPQFTPSDAPPNFLAWNYAEQAPIAYREYKQAHEEVKAMVLRAWKLAKARDLAQGGGRGVQGQGRGGSAKANPANSEAIMRGLRDEAQKAGYRVLNQANRCR